MAQSGQTASKSGGETHILLAFQTGFQKRKLLKKSRVTLLVQEHGRDC